jgi:hypothetical protein
MAPYDGAPTFGAVLQHSAAATIVIPPPVRAAESGAIGPPAREIIRAIARDGRLQWQTATGYGRRALIETAIGRHKGLIGRRLRALLSGSADRGRHRLHRFQSHDGVRTLAFRPLPGTPDIEGWIKDRIGCSSVFHQRHRLALGSWMDTNR